MQASVSQEFCNYQLGFILLDWSSFFYSTAQGWTPSVELAFDMILFLYVFALFSIRASLYHIK